MKKDKKMLYNITAVFLILFAILIGYFIYFTIAKQKEISAHTQNTRLNSLETEVIRGNIYDSSLELLATTENDVRYYLKGDTYAHAVGYSQSGKTGIEAYANKQLVYPSYTLLSLLKNAIFNEKFEGRDIVLTLNHKYQSAIEEAMNGKKGGAVLIEATTGKIRGMYSSTSFDPNKIIENWTALNTDTKDTPLVNRATKGLYPPGSIFKVVTTLAYMIEEGTSDLNFTHNCTGSISGEDYTIKCYNQIVHGEIGLKEAFAQSCNTYFIALNQHLSSGSLKKAAEAVGFNKDLPYDMDYSISRFNLTNSDSEFEKAATAMGQGRTLTSPLHMAILAAAIANDGVSMKPYMLDYSMNKNGSVKVRNLPESEGVLMDEAKAKVLQELMIEVLDTGTAKQVEEWGFTVGGKTGTAQNETDKDHSWFMGFIRDDEGESEPLALAVIVEGGGQGAQALNVVQKIVNVYKEIEQ